MDEQSKYDLAQVFLGCFSDFPDDQIRKALIAASANQTTNALMSRSNYAVCYRTLENLVDWCVANKDNDQRKYDVNLVRKIIRSLRYVSSDKQPVTMSLRDLKYVYHEIRDDVLLVIEGAANEYFERDENQTIEQIVDKVEGGTAWLTEDESSTK